MTDNNDTVLIYAFHGTQAWWKHIGNHLGFAHNVVVCDARRRGDCDVVNDFYARYAALGAQDEISARELSPHEMRDVIARCRLLRWLPERQSLRMVAAMESALAAVLDRVRPTVVLSFPIDRYISDVLERLARRRGVPYLELTVSLISDMCMLMHRGRLVQTGPTPTLQEVSRHVATIADPSFTPSYVQRSARYTRSRWLATFCRFRLRGWVFKAIAWARRDPLNAHYLDAQAQLGHKPRLSDLKVLDLIDWQWRRKVEMFPRERRIFFGLQLFPEASIDYWLAERELIDYEDLLVDAASAFSAAGWLVLVKDHPSQFGFRQRELLERLLALRNVVFLPYDVSGNEVVALVGSNFTLTGTLGLQAGLLGVTSVAAKAYYVTEPDFLTFERRADITVLPERAALWTSPDALDVRQARVLSHLLAGSFDGNFFSFRGHRPRQPDPSVAVLARNLGQRLRQLLQKPPTAYA